FADRPNTHRARAGLRAGDRDRLYWLGVRAGPPHPARYRQRGFPQRLAHAAQRRQSSLLWRRTALPVDSADRAGSLRSAAANLPAVAVKTGGLRPARGVAAMAGRMGCAW